MSDLDDRDLSALIRSTLRRGAESAGVGTGVTGPGLVAALRDRRTARARRRPLRLLALAAALLLPVGLALAATRLTTDDPATGTLAILARPVEVLDGMDIHVVAVAPGGRERELTTFPAAIAPGWHLLPGVVDPSGALALQAAIPGSNDGLVLVDLAHPERAPVTIPGVVDCVDCHSYAWGPDGRLGALTPDGTVLVVDPVTGTVASHDPLRDSPDGFVWTADGSGLVTSFSEGSHVLERFSPLGGTMQLDQAAGVPALYPRPWVRGIVDGGARLGECRAGGFRCYDYYPEDRPGRVDVFEPGTGLWNAFQNGRASDLVRGASLAKDGESVWVLTERTDAGRTYVITRVDRSGMADEVAQAGALPGAVSFYGIAPDDSMIVLWMAGPPDDETPTATILMPTDGTDTTYHQGTLMGFAPAEDVARWPGGDWREMPGSHAPSSARPTTEPDVAADP